MKILSESLFEYLSFKEETDPVKDMGIGIEKEITIWLLENNAVNKDDFVIIPPNFKINTYNTVNLAKLGLKEFPDFIKFGYVMGGFHCDHNELKSLKGTPNIVSGSFLASWNKLPNLIDGPKEVKGDYIVSHNELTSLDGLASVIHGFLSISNNKLKDLKGIPRVLGGNLYIHKNPIETLKYFPDEVDGDVYYTPSKVVYEESIRGRCKVSGNIINKQ
jgi:hypothetical protein